MEAGTASWMEASDGHSSISWTSGKVAAQEIGCRERMGDIVCVCVCVCVEGVVGSQPGQKGSAPACLVVSLGARGSIRSSRKETGPFPSSLGFVAWAVVQGS